MLFPEEDTPLLKAWIVKRIENTSDADSDVLADYVIALLKHDGPAETVRRLCEEEIAMFLTEDSTAFLDDVFQALTYKSYRPGAPPPPKRTAGTSAGTNGTLRTQPAPGPVSSGSIPLDPPPGSSALRKRGFHEGPADEDMSDRRAGQRPTKQPRRGQRGGRGGRRNGRGGPDATVPFGGMPWFDPNNPMEALMQMQAMGLFNGMPAQNGWGNTSRRPGRCQDFDRKGFCSRGSTCPFDHGFMPRMEANEDEYDPTNATAAMANPYSSINPFAFPPSVDGGGKRESQRGRANNKKGGLGSRTALSAEGPEFDRSKSTIVVENIPEESFSEDLVKTFFSQFGEITEITMQPYKHLAVVKYDSWKSANAAYRSPKVIFDNRFVKVFWYKEGGGADKKKNKKDKKARDGEYGKGEDGNEDSAMGDGDQAAEDEEMDMEEFTKKQEEAQKAYDEREAKRLELEQKRQEIEKKQQDLLEMHKEASDKLQARLTEQSGGTTAAASGTDMLRAKLASLEQEAKMLGIDTSAAEHGEEAWGGGGYRGGRGGAGSFRGRGYAPRRRGAFRGYEGRHAAYAQYSLDNRPKRLAVSGVDFTDGEKDETLRHFLLNLGEFESVDTTPEVTHVSFQDRKTAETFYHRLHGKELPGVEGKLDLAWVTTPSASASSSKIVGKGAGVGGKEDGEVEEVEEGLGTALREGSEEGEVEEPAEERRILNMDYEVADDEMWDQ